MEYQDFREKVSEGYFALVTKGAEILGGILDKGEEVYEAYLDALEQNK